MRPVVGQDGVCGNANSNRADDSGLLVHRRFGTGVPAAESLFSHPIPLHVPAATVPEKKCSKEKRLRAEAICRKEIHSLWGLEECVADICVDHGTVSEPQTYDCLAGFAHRRMGWSDDKKRWCCVAHNKGCEQRVHDRNSYFTKPDVSDHYSTSWVLATATNAVSLLVREDTMPGPGFYRY